MTAVLAKLGSQRAPTSSRVFQFVVAATILTTVAVAALNPSDVVSLTVVGVVIVVLGVPHGALDHLVEAPVQSSPGTNEPWRTSDVLWQLRFHAAYLALMFVYGVVWFWFPAFALVGFLVLSVHHFGQSDLAYLGLARHRQLTIQLSRGLFLVGLPLVAHLSTVAPVLERLGGVDPMSWSWLADHTVTWTTLLVAQHLLAGGLVAVGADDRSAVGRETLTVASLTALFVAADPLIGFAVYFGLWHSLNHLHVLASVLGSRAGSDFLPPVELARLAAPRSIVSLGGLVVFVVGFVASGRTELIVPAAIVFVSMLTLPHMFVVERMWRPGGPVT
jgi:Brp/Blh family beta-carotene 15,15'-monooxygenase